MTSHHITSHHITSHHITSLIVIRHNSLILIIKTLGISLCYQYNFDMFFSFSDRESVKENLRKAELILQEAEKRALGAVLLFFTYDS